MYEETIALAIDDGSRSRHARHIEGKIEIKTEPSWKSGKYVSYKIKTPCRIAYIMHDYYKYQARSYTKLTAILCGIPIAVLVLFVSVAVLFKNIFFATLCGFLLTAIIIFPAAVHDGHIGIEKIPVLKYVPRIKYCKQLYELTSKLEGYKEIIGIKIDKHSGSLMYDKKINLIIDFVDFCGYKEQVKFDITDFEGREIYNDGTRESFCYIDLTEKYYEVCGNLKGSEDTLWEDE